MRGLPRWHCGQRTRPFRFNGAYIRECMKCRDEWAWDPKYKEYTHAVLWGLF